MVNNNDSGDAADPFRSTRTDYALVIQNLDSYHSLISFIKIVFTDYSEFYRNRFFQKRYTYFLDKNGQIDIE